MSRISFLGVLSLFTDPIFLQRADRSGWTKQQFTAAKPNSAAGNPGSKLVASNSGVTDAVVKHDDNDFEMVGYDEASGSGGAGPSIKQER